MSYSSINGINAARNTGGLAGTRRAPLQTQGGQQPMPAQMPQSMGGNPRPATPLGGGGGMAGIPMRPAPRTGGGMMGSAPATLQNTGMMNTGTYAAPDNGVRPGTPGPQLAGPAPVQFDPNDPRNAALSGYMNGA